jgi:ABC-type taurine transport system ATPase subunit
MTFRPRSLCRDEPRGASHDETRQQMHDLLADIRSGTGGTTLRITDNLAERQRA